MYSSRIIFGCLATSQNMLYLPPFKTGHLSNGRIHRQGQYLQNLIGQDISRRVCHAVDLARLRDAEFKFTT